MMIKTRKDLGEKKNILNTLRISTNRLKNVENYHVSKYYMCVQFKFKWKKDQVIKILENGDFKAHSMHALSFI